MCSAPHAPAPGGPRTNDVDLDERRHSIRQRGRDTHPRRSTGAGGPIHHAHTVTVPGLDKC